jgi:hypothetical protein
MGQCEQDRGRHQCPRPVSRRPVHAGRPSARRPEPRLPGRRCRYDVTSERLYRAARRFRFQLPDRRDRQPSTEYRPLPACRRPVVQGPQTAIVVGKAGEEIWTDKYGRIKVQFHWDRVGQSDENSSCWVRVAQGWAGKGWGAMACRASAWRSSSASSRAIPTGRWSPACLYNADACRPTICRPSRPVDRQEPVVEGRRRLQRTALRGQEGQRGSVHARRARFPARGEEQRRAGLDRPRPSRDRGQGRLRDVADKGDQTIDIKNDQAAHPASATTRR